eukprot:g27511.t1
MRHTFISSVNTGVQEGTPHRRVRWQTEFSYNLKHKTTSRSWCYERGSHTISLVSVLLACSCTRPGRLPNPGNPAKKYSGTRYHVRFQKTTEAVRNARELCDDMDYEELWFEEDAWYDH